MRRLLILLVMLFGGTLATSAQVDGTKLAFVSHTLTETDVHYTVQIYDFDTQTLSDIGGMQFDDVRHLTWSSTGTLAFVGRQNRTDHAVYIWDGELKTPAAGADDYSQLTWSADGNRLALTAWLDRNGTQMNVQVWDGVTVQSLCTPDEKCSQPAWSADGKRLAFTSPDGAVYNFPCGDCGPLPPDSPSGIKVWDGEQIVIPVDVSAVDYRARNPVWMPDGRLLFTAEIPDESSSVTLMSWDGTTVTPLRPLIDGRYIWNTAGDLAIVSTPYGAGMVNVDVIRSAWNPDSPIVNLVESAGFIEDVSWSQDGRLVFASEFEGDYGVFVHDGNTLSAAAQSDAYDKSPAWSENGLLAFVSDRADYNFDLYLWDGQDAVRLLDLPDTHEVQPVWWLPVSS